MAKPINKTSAWRVMWKEVRGDKLALLGLVLFIAILLTVYIWAGFFIDIDAVGRVNLFERNSEPRPGHRLGFDSQGRDVIPQLIMGARNSLNISFGVTIPGAIIGIFVGLIAGFYGKHVDNAIMRLMALWGMVPGMMLIILLRTIFTPGVFGFALMMTVVGAWMGMAGMVRIMALRQGALDYVAASKTLGTPNIIIIFREVLPNLVSIITSQFTISLAANMGLETGLTFLGFGLPPGTPSLGRLVAYAQSPTVLQNRWWQWLPAALLIVVMMLCINFVGQALNRAADAKKRRV